MNEEQRKFYKVPFEKREEVFFGMFPEAKLLKEKLLGIGGQLVAWRHEEPHLRSLLDKGQNFSLNKRKKFSGEVHGCHANTARLFLEKDVSIVTGYALSKDRWIQHSWGYDGKRIVETTCSFNAYYGVILSDLEITKFVIGELGDQIMKLPKEQVMKLPMPKDIKELR